MSATKAGARIGGSRGRALPEAPCTQVPPVERRDPAGSTSCASAVRLTLLAREHRKPPPHNSVI